MSDYAGRIIRATEPTVTTTSASGVWTVEEALKYKQAGTWPTPVYADPNFNQTVLLLHGDGTNGAQNNTFLDSSTNNFTITRNGNTTQGTFSPFSLAEGEWSNYFDGAGDELTLAHNTALSVGSSNFTIEFWIYPTSFDTYNRYVWFKRPVLEGRGIGIGFTQTTGTILLLAGDSNNSSWEVVITSSSGAPLNTWSHIAITRSSSTWTVYLNGTSVGSATASFTVDDGSGTAYLGSSGNSSNYIAGYVSNFRLVKGSVVYTGNFTPPTSPLTAITNTSLLTCQSNRFVDNSTNAFAITRNGDVRVTPFSPFAPTAAYSAGTNGGSGYFDGISDFLTTPNDSAFAFGTGDFTIEAWVYLTGASPSNVAHTIFATRTDDINFTNAFSFAISSANRFPFFYTNAYIAQGATGSVQYSSWNHLAICRSGSSLAIYVNGVSVATATNTQNLTLSTATIGCLASGDEDLLGHISNLRVIKGQALTTGAFTPPTSLVTSSAVGWTGANVAASITGTVSILCNFTNAGIIDNTGKNNLETVGNAQIDTTTKKYGTGSMEFDGTGDYLVYNLSSGDDLGSGDFTIELWFYLNATGSQRFISARDNNGGLTFGINSSTQLSAFYGEGTGIMTGSTSISTGSFNHAALVRSSGTATLYLNGVSQGTSDWSSKTFSSTQYRIGTSLDTRSESLNGYIDDLRITKGVARYTANFTPPTASFLDQ